MTRLEHTTVIQKPLSQVFALARQVEHYPEFLPGYIESRITDRREDALLLERAALIQGHLYRWKSWVRFEENRSICFEQAEGPLRGMKVEWQFDSMGSSETRVTIIHRFHLNRPWAIGRWIERFVYKPKIAAMAALVVAALKRVCEKEDREVVPI